MSTSERAPVPCRHPRPPHPSSQAEHLTGSHVPTARPQRWSRDAPRETHPPTPHPPPQGGSPSVSTFSTAHHRSCPLVTGRGGAAAGEREHTSPQLPPWHDRQRIRHCRARDTAPTCPLTVVQVKHSALSSQTLLSRGCGFDSGDLPCPMPKRTLHRTKVPLFPLVPPPVPPAAFPPGPACGCVQALLLGTGARDRGPTEGGFPWTSQSPEHTHRSGWSGAGNPSQGHPATSSHNLAGSDLTSHLCMEALLPGVWAWPLWFGQTSFCDVMKWILGGQCPPPPPPPPPLLKHLQLLPRVTIF